jgi:hypothetical protein
MKSKLYPVITAVSAAAVMLLIAPGSHVKAFNPQPDPPAFGMIGIAINEAARVNAVCSAGMLPGNATPSPCTVTLAFEDVNHNLLQQTTVTLQPGQGTFLDLHGSDLARGGARRVEAQPCIKPAGTGFVLGTVEIFDELTGRSAAVLNTTEPRSLNAATSGQ